MTTPKIAVLTFPGNNCETETVRALKKQRFHSEVFLWNRTPSELQKFDGVVIPGGFSFEDRGRSGIVSSQEPIFTTLHAMANEGMPILGICNGAQMLVESGLILADSNKIPAIALLHNKRMNENGEILGTGFYHSYRTLTPANKQTPFSNFTQNITVPIAHGEGRFTLTSEMEKAVRENNLVVFTYTENNPNGSFENAAAISNPKGNVVAMMPHPERNENGDPVFESLWNFFEETNNGKKSEALLQNATITIPNFAPRIPEKVNADEITVLVQLKITDKTEKTFENVLGTSATDTLTRQEKWGFVCKNAQTAEEKISIISKIITSGELVNVNKEHVTVKINGEWYTWTDEAKFVKTQEIAEDTCFIVEDLEDFKGQAKQQHIAHIFPELEISDISFGVYWNVPADKKIEYIENPLFSTRVGNRVRTF